jgi:hypothetical protein
MPPALFCFLYLSKKFLFLCLCVPGLLSSYLYFPSNWNGSIVPPHTAFYWLRCGLASPRMLQTTDFLTSTSQEARIISVSRHAWLDSCSVHIAQARVGFQNRYIQRITVRPQLNKFSIAHYLLNHSQHDS